MNGIPDQQTLQQLIHTIEQTPPRPHQSALLTALAQALPELTFQPVLSSGGWHRAGGVYDANGNELDSDLEHWVNGELEKCADDIGRFLDRHHDAGLLVTSHDGCTHYLTASYGAAAEEFIQLEVEELQEVLDRHLIDPDQTPTDRQELVEPLTPAKVDAHPVGSPRYRFVRMVDMREVLARQPASVAGDSPLARFMSEWSQSRAAGRDHFCQHWVITGLEAFDSSMTDPSTTTPFTARPLSVHNRKLKPFHWDVTRSGAELGNQIRDFDRAASYPGAWYFHFVASKLVPETIASALKSDIDSGYSYLAEKDLGLLNNLVAKPYRAA